MVKVSNNIYSACINRHFISSQVLYKCLHEKHYWCDPT